MKNTHYSRFPAIVVLAIMMMLGACSKPKYYVFKTVRHKPPVDKKVAPKPADNTAKEQTAKLTDPVPTKNHQTETSSVDVVEKSLTASTDKLVVAADPTTQWVAPAQPVAKKMSKFKQIRTALKLKKELRRLKKDWNQQSEVYDATGDTQESSGKSQLIALVLAALIGVLGIHRFYLGYTTIGIIQLLTLGGCGIWALIDLIRIITGDLKPIDGEYEETL